jgi:hypothetical protein
VIGGLAALLLVAACSRGGHELRCNYAAVAPSLRIDFSQYQSRHAAFSARICRTALRAEAVSACPVFVVDANGRQTLTPMGGSNRLEHGRVAMFAPPYGMVVTVTLSSADGRQQRSLRLAGSGGRCGAYSYPPLRVTADGALVA